MAIVGISIVLNERKSDRKALWGVSLALIVLGFAISLYNILPGQTFTPRFPPYATSWSIAVDSLKDSPFLGIGPGNYLTAYNRYRPIAMNFTELWAVKFATANSFYLTALTETGMLGAAGLILLLLSLYRIFRGRQKPTGMNLKSMDFAKLAALILLVAILFFIPASTLIIFLLFVTLALNSEAKATTLNLTAASADESTTSLSSKVPALLVAAPVIVVVALVLFNASRVLVAEYTFTRSLAALALNEAGTTYDTMQQAIQQNPRVDRYHATFSRVNLALANSIAQREEITDQDRQDITVLIQQAITESKNAIALNPLRAGNWEILGQTYRAIVPLAQGADVFAVQTYRQAVALDPINPNLRISLGGIYYAAGDFQTAADIFRLATQAKPDHANAHFNYAIALRELGQFDEAIQEMTLVLSLVERDSQDYQVAQQALEDLQEERREAQVGTGQELVPPAEGEEPILEPPLDLPEGSEPPELPVTPTPTPEEGEENEETDETTPTPSP